MKGRREKDDLGIDGWLVAVVGSITNDRSSDMSLKKFGAVLVAMLAIGAVVASSASAAVSTTRAEWYTGASPGTTLPVGTDEAINLAMIEHNGVKSSTFNVTILGVPVELTSTSLSCTTCNITNKEVTKKAGAIAYGTGTVTFENVTVKKPANCKVFGETGVEGMIPTKLLQIHGDFMDTTAGNNKAFIQFLPDTPEGTGTFAQFQLKGTGCEAIEASYNVTGSLFVESKNDTGVFGTTQDATASAAVQSTAEAGLKVGVNNATLTGSVRASLASGKSFAIKP